MTNSPPRTSNHLTTQRPYSPALHQRASRSPGLAAGSATQTITSTPQRSESPEALVLRLRGALTPQQNSEEATRPRRRSGHIQWAEDVIDNEGLGRKKSKVCCIYHKPRPVGESSDESSSDSSSDSDSDIDVGRDGARPVGGGKANGRRGRHNHNHDEDGCDDHAHGKGRQAKPARRPSPNAYERMPKYDVQPLNQQPGRMS